ncbi:MAG: carboxypeptidase-like regulatory domain-containing protein, partial [Phycisphaerales bacterium]
KPAVHATPLGGVRVSLTNVESGLLAADSITGNDGSYYFDDVKPGRYKLAVDPKTVPPAHVLSEQERIIVVEPTRKESQDIPMPDITAIVQSKQKPSNDQNKEGGEVPPADKASGPKQ